MVIFVLAWVHMPCKHVVSRAPFMQDLTFYWDQVGVQEASQIDLKDHNLFGVQSDPRIEQPGIWPIHAKHYSYLWWSINLSVNLSDNWAFNAGSRNSKFYKLPHKLQYFNVYSGQCVHCDWLKHPPPLPQKQEGCFKVFTWTMSTFFCWFYNFSYALKNMQSTEVGFPGWSYNFSYPPKSMQFTDGMTTCIITSYGKDDANPRNPKYHTSIGSLVIWNPLPHTSAILDTALISARTLFLVLSDT